MGVYIPGVEMPADGNETIIRIQSDGTVLDQYGHHLGLKALFVPEHGRLGDLDELEKLFLKAGENHKGIGGLMTGRAALCVREMPTIIPASKEVRT